MATETKPRTASCTAELATAAQSYPTSDSWPSAVRGSIEDLVLACKDIVTMSFQVLPGYGSCNR